jgi:hypothetical protein
MVATKVKMMSVSKCAKKLYFACNQSKTQLQAKKQTKKQANVKNLGDALDATRTLESQSERKWGNLHTIVS